jgi:hypothetical protein
MARIYLFVFVVVVVIAIVSHHHHLSSGIWLLGSGCWDLGAGIWALLSAVSERDTRDPAPVQVQCTVQGPLQSPRRLPFLLATDHCTEILFSLLSASGL